MPEPQSAPAPSGIDYRALALQAKQNVAAKGAAAGSGDAAKTPAPIDYKALAQQAKRNVAGKQPAAAPAASSPMDTILPADWLDQVGRGFAATALPIHDEATLQQAKDYFTNPKSAPLIDLAKSIVTSQLDQFHDMVQHGINAGVQVGTGKGGAAISEASQGFLHYLAAMTPVVGPQLEQAGELFPQGKHWEGFGQILGIVGPMLLSESLGKVKPTKASGLVDGVPLLRSERTGSTVAKFGEQLVEKSLPGGGTFRDFRIRQQAALIDGSAERLAGKISNYKGTTTDLVQMTRQALEAEQLRVKGITDKLYSEIDEETRTTTRRRPVYKTEQSSLVDAQGKPMTYQKRTLVPVEEGGVQPATAGVKQIAIDMLRRIRTEEKLIPSQELNSRAVKILERIIKSDHHVPYAAMKDARSDLLGISRSFDEPIPGKLAGLSKKIATAVDDAMEEAANKVGEKDPETGRTPLQSKVREANALWRSAKEDFNSSVITKVLKDNPLHVPALLKTVSLEDLRTLKMRLPEAQWQALKVTLYRDMLGNAIKETAAVLPAGTEAYNAAASHTSPVVPQVPVTTLQTLRGDRLLSEITDLGERGTVLFRPTEIAGMRELGSLASRVAAKPSTSVPNLLAAGMNAGMLYETLRAVQTGDPAALAKVGGTAVGVKTLALVMTHPEGLTTLRRFVHAVNQDTPRQIAFWATRLTQLAVKQDQASSDQSSNPSPSSTAGAGPVR